MSIKKREGKVRAVGTVTAERASAPSPMHPAEEHTDEKLAIFLRRSLVASTPVKLRAA